MQPTMIINKQNEKIQPLIVLPVNGEYIVGVYQGTLSEFDLLIKYRQKLKTGNWSMIRTPKHIHWAVDILIKMHENESDTKCFLDFLIDYWNNRVKPIKSVEERNALLDEKILLQSVNEEAQRYLSLSGKGEYSIKFLILLAKLLITQEKTNREDAYMFGNVLKSLREGKDIFSIISAATHNGR